MKNSLEPGQVNLFDNSRQDLQAACNPRRLAHRSLLAYNAKVPIFPGAHKLGTLRRSFWIYQAHGVKYSAHKFCFALRSHSCSERQFQ